MTARPAASAAVADGATAAGPPVSYYESVKPLLAVHCDKCHGPETAKAGLRLDDAEWAMAGGESGRPAVAAGDSGRSELVRRITSRDPEERMPPKGPRLADHEVEAIRRWIDQGAAWPARDDYWAFAPPRDPPIPPAAARGVDHPIDRFVDARQKTAGITPAPPADARTLLRRAYADLLGVPPTPEEAEQFLADGSADAYERLVDRLLADPRYGERWARHWLDLARYGESDGYEDDKVRPHAWRYRDYVIRSFNADKPYDRFVREQVAGDELWPGDADAWVATGFARLGSWDGMSKDPARQRQDFLNDATDAVGAAFLGMTVGCARCHDHKYDRVTQRDYYGLQAFFAGVKREVRDLPGDPGDPPAVREAHAAATAERARAAADRDALLAEARAAVEAERKAKAEAKPGPTPPAKVSNDDVRRRADATHPGRLAKLDAAVKDADRRAGMTAPRAEVVVEDGSRPPATRLLLGGELARPGPEVAPRFVEAMVPPGGENPAVEPPSGRKTSGRRAALANWLASPDHPLVARVMVNRLWQHHFGRGIVATPSDLGRNGRRPTHPELLDWLARRFVADGFSLKRMHRLMMTSAAYRRSSGPDPAASAVDPGNALWWRADRRRLEAEAVRDTLLAVAGRLSPARGGPGVYARLPAGVSVALPNNDKELSWYAATEEEDRRRSVYLFQRRSLTFPLIDVFDGPAMNQSCAARAVTTVAPQALALFNGAFARESARHFADRVRREAGPGPGPAAQVERAFRVAFARGPSAAELAEAVAFLSEQAARRPADGAAAPAAALVDFCHVILNANELIYVD